jgi:general L-amino acid transport system permease protein
MAQAQKYPPGTHPDLDPPASLVGVRGWLMQNIFSTPMNMAISAVCLYLLYIIIPPMVSWLVLDATWGSVRTDCAAESGTREGACWPFIVFWSKQLMYGRYPDTELWRINLSYAIFTVSMITLFIPSFRYKHWVGVFLLFIFPVICFYLYAGGSFGLIMVETPVWGGFFLTLVIAFTGIVASLPLGVVLALGRQSDMPIVKSLCVCFIELVRGVPLITVLFMSSVMFPLFMPEGLHFDKLVRALVGVTLFSAAYMAEVVRGGMQAIPRGQYEGAQAMGLGYWRMMILVILPQALKLVIPAIVSSFIGLFKDSTLVLVIGLFDFLGMAQLVATNTDWLGFTIEGYVVVAFGFWICCFSMSRYSMSLEEKLNTGHKR